MAPTPTASTESPVNWLNQVPVPIPGAPNMTWAAWIWFAGFAIAGISFVRLAWHALLGFRAATVGRGRSEHLLAAGLLVQQVDSLAIVVAGLTIGVLGVTGPHQVLAADVRASAGLLALLVIPLLKALQGVLAVWFHERALEALPKEET